MNEHEGVPITGMLIYQKREEKKKSQGLWFVSPGLDVWPIA